MGKIEQRKKKKESEEDARGEKIPIISRNPFLYYQEEMLNPGPCHVDLILRPRSKRAESEGEGGGRSKEKRGRRGWRATGKEGRRKSSGEGSPAGEVKIHAPFPHPNLTPPLPLFKSPSLPPPIPQKNKISPIPKIDSPRKLTEGILRR